MKSFQWLSLMSMIGLVAVFAACANPAGNAGEPADIPASPTSLSSPGLPPGPTATLAPSPISSPDAQITPMKTISITPSSASTLSSFDGQRAFTDVERQVAFGPRLPGSQAHKQVVAWLQDELSASGWSVELQETTYRNKLVTNVIAKRGAGQSPWIILGAHYDSRFYADRDPDPSRQADPVPGANDGASGVAVLVELARILPEDLPKQVWLVFFDAEDQGQISGWDWILGSRAFVKELSGNPDSVIIIDMIGDDDLNIYKERNSDPGLTDEIWRAAAEKGHSDVFIPEYRYNILDDHIPFLEKGLRAIDIIDFDYTYWHTAQDTPDKVSGQSLQAVGDTLLHWLIRTGN